MNWRFFVRASDPSGVLRDRLWEVVDRETGLVVSTHFTRIDAREIARLKNGDSDGGDRARKDRP
jgi:hypothetical protein